MTKKEKTARCREILYKNPFGGRVDDIDSEFLMNEVFCNHPEFERKVGVGVDFIEVNSDGYGGMCFWLVRKDGTTTDISFTASLKNKRKIDVIRDACRYAVFDEIQKERNKIVLPYVCPLTGKMIYDIKDIHIDHYDMKFEEVVDEWLKNQDEKYVYDDAMKSSCDNSTKTYFSDDNLIHNFKEFHNTHTHLRAIYGKENLRIH